MLTKTKIYIAALASTLILTALLLMISSSMISIALVSKKNQPQVDLVKMKNDYKTKTKELVFRLNSADASSEASVKEIRNELLLLKVPSQYRNLHIDLVMATDRLNEYIKTGDQQKKDLSDKLIAKARNDYSWLN